MKCLWCGVETNQPVRDFFQHFWLYKPGQWQYLRGNVQTFGKWDGFWGTIALAFPIYNTLRHWRYRKARLELRKPWDQLMTDEQRRELAGLLSILQSATRLHAQGGDVIGGSRERAIAQARHEIFALVDRWLPEQTMREQR